MAVRRCQRLVELLVTQVVELDRVPWLLRKQPRELAPEGFRGAWPIGIHRITLPQPPWRDGLLGGRLTVGRHDAKTRRLAVEVSAFADHGFTPALPSDRQIGVG